MMQKIAKEAGFKASVTAEAGKIELPHLDQINESDMALLTRVARENGLIFKAGAARLRLGQLARHRHPAARPCRRSP